MSKPLQRRLRKIEQFIGSLPVDPVLLRKAYEHFQRTGELPDDDKLARKLISWVESGVDPTQFSEDFDGRAAHIRAAVAGYGAKEDPVMNALWREAVCTSDVMRMAARDVLRWIASVGADPTEPMFRKLSIEIEPTCSSMGLTLLGFPECLYGQHYQESGPALFAKLHRIRDKVDGDRVWLDRFAKATGAFRRTGELPGEPLLREAVLCDAEIGCMIRTESGLDNPELRAALFAAHEGSRDREQAIARVQELVAAGALAPLE